MGQNTENIRPVLDLQAVEQTAWGPGLRSYFWRERMASKAVPLPDVGREDPTSALKGFQRCRKDKGNLASVSLLVGETNCVTEVAGPLEHSSALHKLPLHRSPFLGLETVAIKQGQGRGETLPQASPGARCRHLRPVLPWQEARGWERYRHWFQITASTTWHRGGSPQAALAADHKTSGQSGRPTGWGHWPTGTSRLCVCPHRPGSHRACSPLCA